MSTKIDSAHVLANTTVLERLTGGIVDGTMSSVGASPTTVSGNMASSTAGSDTLVKEALPALPETIKVSAIIKVDKTAGRHSWVGVSTQVVGSTTTSSNYTFEVGHTAGTGLQVRSQGSGFGSAFTLCAEANLTDGEEYRVTLVWTGQKFANPGGSDNGRVGGWAEYVDGSRIPYTQSNVVPADRRADPTTIYPQTLIARTNSPNGTIRDLIYSDNMFAASEKFGVFRAFPYYGTGGERMGIWTKGISAPLRIVVFTGGTSTYGGWNNSMGYVLAGSPRENYSYVHHELAKAGYTVITPNALQEGWGHDTSLASVLESIADIEAIVGVADERHFQMGYSAGGMAVWRSMMGRASFPPVVGGYLIAGSSNASTASGFPGFQTKWGTDPAFFDSPTDWTNGMLTGRNTMIRSIIGTSDTNVPKDENHDLMKAIYAGSPLFEELVLSGVSHFQAPYWDGTDVVDFFDRADTAWLSTGAGQYNMAKSGSWVAIPRSRAKVSAWTAWSGEQTTKT